MRSGRMRGAAASAALVMLAVAACGGSSDDDGDKTSGGDTNAVLTVAAEAEPATLDLTTVAAAAIPRLLLYNVYEGLVKLDGKGEIQPLLAKSWKVSEDRTTYTFTMQDDAKFSTGRKLTAADAVFSIDRARAADSKHPFKSQLAVVESATAKDDTTLVVKLKRTSNSFLYSMANPVGIVYDKDSIGEVATKPVGSGPFTFGEFVRGSKLTLTRNEGYWGKKAKVASVVFRFFTDATATVNAALAGELDLVTNVRTPEAIARFQGNPAYTVVEGTTNGEVVMALNNEKGPLKDKRVRQAIIHAIDRAALVKTASAGYGELIGSMVPPTDPWYEDLSKQYPFDPAKAKALLAEAGFANGVTLQMKLPTRPDALAAGRFVEAQLKAVGITAKTTQLEFPARWLDVVFTKADYDISIISHVEPRDIEKYGDPKFYWRYQNPKAKELLTQADAGSPEEQIAKLKELARLLADDAASNWLYLQPSLQVLKKGVSGYPENAATLSYDMTNIQKA